jgi:hypothetical protein
MQILFLEPFLEYKITAAPFYPIHFYKLEGINKWQQMTLTFESKELSLVFDFS